MSSIVTVIAVPKLLPLMLIDVPPEVGPKLGVIDNMIDVAAGE